MSDWEVGDLALCVDDGPPKTLGGCGELTNRTYVDNLIAGRIYRVTDIERGKYDPSFIGIGDRAQQAGGWEARFQKIDRCEDEFTELMRQMKPMPEKVS